MTLRPITLTVLCVALLALAAVGYQPVGTGVANWRDRGEPFVRPGKLDNGDVVRVTLFGVFAPDGHDAFDLHVDHEGNLHVPMVGIVPVKGLTTDRAAAAIAAAEAKINLQDDAIVIVGLVRTAAETRVKPGPILVGENLRITVFDITGPSDRLEVLAQIAEDGTVTLPAIGAIKLTELHEAAASDAVSKAFKQKNVIDDATVSVLRLDSLGLP